jgi:hypothetical protein
VIIIQSSVENYCPDTFIYYLNSDPSAFQCPACMHRGTLKRHGIYKKYCRDVIIPIVRVRCKTCGVTHSLIPSFSLPGTSFAVSDLERHYINKKLYPGTSTFLKSKISLRYYHSLGNKLDRSVLKAKSLFPSQGNPCLCGLDWIYSVIGVTAEPLLCFNLFCLSNNINCLFFSRCNYLRYSHPC